jgi:2-methylisocitrate lyase-like PEP mutase family enzyme
MVVFPVAGVLAAAHALGDVYAALHRDGTTASRAGRMLGFDALNALLGLEELYRREREWLRRD